MIRAELLDAAGNLGLRPGVGGRNFRIGGAKMFVDGAFGPRSACMSAPYSDTGSSGSMQMDEGEMEAVIRKGAALGWQMCVHAIATPRWRRRRGCWRPIRLPATPGPTGSSTVASPPAPLSNRYAKQESFRCRSSPSCGYAPPISWPRWGRGGWGGCIHCADGSTPG